MWSASSDTKSQRYIRGLRLTYSSESKYLIANTSTLRLDQSLLPASFRLAASFWL